LGDPTLLLVFGSKGDGTLVDRLTSLRLLGGDEDGILGKSRFIDNRDVRVMGPGGESKSGHEDWGVGQIIVTCEEPLEVLATLLGFDEEVG